MIIQKHFWAYHRVRSLAVIVSLTVLIWYLISSSGPDVIICKLPTQVFGRIMISSKDMVCGIDKCHYNNGFCDNPVVEKHVIKPLVILSTLLKPSKIFDIGSNIGIFSIYSSDLAPIVLSYDIQTDLNDLLMKSSNKYKNILVQRCGLGAKSERGWTPDGFKEAKGQICDLEEIDFSDSIIKLDTDGNEEAVVNKILDSSFLAMILEVTPLGWKKGPDKLMDYCDHSLCFLTEADDLKSLDSLTRFHRSSLLNYVDSPVANSTMISRLFHRKLVHNLIIIGKSS